MNCHLIFTRFAINEITSTLPDNFYRIRNDMVDYSNRRYFPEEKLLKEHASAARPQQVTDGAVASESTALPTDEYCVIVS